jgi:hypothetical protein
MMEERVIVTDYFDNPIGDGSKKESASAGSNGGAFAPPCVASGAPLRPPLPGLANDDIVARDD